MKVKGIKQYGFGVGVVIAFFASQVMAQETIGPWSAQAELGFLSSNGNSESQSVNGRLGMTYDIEKMEVSRFDRRA